jgi:foldase protein PrsA
MKHWVVTAGIALAAFVAGLALHAPAPLAAFDSPVASKDGKTFTLEDVDIYWLHNLGSNGVIDFLQHMALYEEGLKLNLKPADAEVDDFIKTAIGPDTYKQFVQLYSEHAVRQMVEALLVNRKYDQYLHDKIVKDHALTVTAQEANQFYLQHIDQYDLPPGAYLSVISVETKAQADAVLKRLKAGEDFNTVASQVNMDEQMRAQKGQLGLWRKGDGNLPKEMEDAAEKLQTGQYSAVIQGKYFHILYCNKLAPEVTTSFDDVKEELIQDMLEQKVEPYYDDAIGELMKRELPRFQIQAELFRPTESEEQAAGNPAEQPAHAPAGGAAKGKVPAAH